MDKGKKAILDILRYSPLNGDDDMCNLPVWCPPEGKGAEACRACVADQIIDTLDKLGCFKVERSPYGRIARLATAEE